MRFVIDKILGVLLFGIGLTFSLAVFYAITIHGIDIRLSTLLELQTLKAHQNLVCTFCNVSAQGSRT